MKIFLVVITLLAAVSAKRFSYERYKVYRIQPSGEKQLEILLDLKNDSELDFWSPLSRDGQPLDVMVNPKKEYWFVSLLNKNAIQHEILIDNVERVVLEERLRQLFVPRSQQGRIDFTRYLRHDEINAYLDQLAEDCPNLVSLETIGKSYEGRALKLVKISTNSSANKPIIFIDAGVHAREWIAPPVALYAIQQLVENEKNLKLLEKIDWHILPVVNPDGYEYTHKTNRLWRKTRKPGIICRGTDGNRNYDFHWAEIGSSNTECSETYHGKHAFSEPEIVLVRDHVLQNKDRIKLYISLHSYGQLILYPWSYTTEKPEDHEELDALGELVAESIKKVANTNYVVGSSTSILREIAGSSSDWVKGVGGVALSYTIELPGGVWGFQLPPEKILPVVVETWKGLKTFHEYTEKKFG
ncbi:hypothetical protein ILUMI_09719 [Ignelater luminosus]|uniref:Zinc carboxypeptidase A 1 n=1 Tax=Ignelater luminosus TaxID=2038154 RepID=A0A8K0CZF6_IGNLU|nr:hypothetical protein ILUMI_09719 [Ignelater luminosus]